MPTVPRTSEEGQFQYPERGWSTAEMRKVGHPLEPDPKNPFQRMFGTAPPAAREFAATVAGSKEDITESNFTQSELDILRDAAERAFKKGEKGSEPGTTQMGYGDYAPGVKGEKSATTTFQGTSSVKHALTDLPSSLAFTLGMANVRKDKDGSIVITDKYDFAARKEQVDKLKAEGGMAIVEMAIRGLKQNGLLGPLNLIGNLVAPEDHGRTVKIRIPPRGNGQ